MNHKPHEDINNTRFRHWLFNRDPHGTKVIDLISKMPSSIHRLFCLWFCSGLHRMKRAHSFYVLGIFLCEDWSWWHAFNIQRGGKGSRSGRAWPLFVYRYHTTTRHKTSPSPSFAGMHLNPGIVSNNFSITLLLKSNMYKLLLLFLCYMWISGPRNRVGFSHSHRNGLEAMVYPSQA